MTNQVKLSVCHLFCVNLKLLAQGNNILNKRATLQSIFMLCFLTSFCQLSGSYAVGPEGDYTSILEALDAIKSEGVGADIILNIAEGTYFDNLDFRNLNNQDYTITLRGTNKSTTIIAPNGFIKVGGKIRAGILIRDIDHITFENITLDMSGISTTLQTYTTDRSQGIKLQNTSNINFRNIDFYNNNSNFLDTSTESDYISSSLSLQDVGSVEVTDCFFSGAGIHIFIKNFEEVDISGSTFEKSHSSVYMGWNAATIENGSITIEDNEFIEDWYVSEDVIALQGTASLPIQQVVIRSNTIVGSNDDATAETLGIKVNYSNKTLIQGNMVKVSYVGVSAFDINDFTISGNEITAMRGINDSRSGKTVYYNNIVEGLEYAVYPSSFEECTMLFNTFYATGEDYTVQVYDGTGTLKIVNNILSGSDAIDAIVRISSSTIEDFFMDHNLFSEDVASPFSIVNSSLNEISTSFESGSFADWQNSEFGLDQNSQSFQPEFEENSLRLISRSDYAFGLFIDTVLVDIDGDPRTESGGTTVGADEICEASGEAYIKACDSYDWNGIVYTEDGTYEQNLTAALGCDSLATLHLSFGLPNDSSAVVAAIDEYDWQGLFLYESGVYEQTFLNEYGCDSLVTLELIIVPSGTTLSGDYSVGSSDDSDFDSFSQLEAVLTIVPISGDLNITLENGTYTDALDLESINNGDYSIAFRGQSKESTILRPSDLFSSAINVINTSKIIIEDITLNLDDLSEELSNIFRYENQGLYFKNSSNIVIDNISISVETSTKPDTSYVASGLFLDEVSNITIRESYFSGTGFQINLINTDGVDILNNEFEEGRYAVYQDKTSPGQRMHIQENRFTEAYTGIYLHGEANRLTEVIILSNIFTAQIRRDVQLFDMKSYEINSNEVRSPDGVGLFISNSEEGVISGNDVIAQRGFDIYFQTSLVMYNNIIVGSEYSSTILEDINQAIIVHNTLYTNGTGIFSYTSSGAVYTLGIHNALKLTGNYEDLYIKNNLFDGVTAAGENGNTGLLLDACEIAHLVLDHNLYSPLFYNAVTIFSNAEINGVSYSPSLYFESLSDWQVELGLDANSRYLTTDLGADKTYRNTGNSDFRFGEYLSDYPADIDGELREENRVDVGADQDINTAYWSGLMDSNWFDDANWDEGVVPEISQNVIIMTSYHDPVISGDAVVNNLTIESGATLTIESGSGVNIQGAVRGAGQAIMYRNTTGNGGYSIIGSMVENMSVYDLEANYIYSFDGESYQLPVSDEKMETGKGYFAAFNDPSPAVTFYGTLNSGTQSYSLPSADKFHLVANPYAAAVNHSSLVVGNTSFDGTIYLWDDGGSNTGGLRDGGYVTVNAAGITTGAGGLQGKDAFNGNIGSGQGFFIYTDAATSIDFTPSMQSTTTGNNSDEAYYRTTAPQYFRLSLSSEDYRDDLVVMLHEDATDSFDAGLDARKLKNANLSFFSMLDEQELAIQAISKNFEEVMIPLAYQSVIAGKFQIKVDELESLSTQLEILLLDAETGEEYDLRNQDVTALTLSATKDDGRFNLVLRTSKALSIHDIESSLLIYGNAEELKIYYPSATSEEEVFIHDMNGKELLIENVHFEAGVAVIDVAIEEDTLYVIRVGETISKFRIK